MASVRVAPGAELTPEALREAACGALPRGLRGGERLSLGLGLGDPVAEPDDLRHTLAEARSARRVAAGPEAEAVAVRGTGDMAAYVTSRRPCARTERRTGPVHRACRIRARSRTVSSVAASGTRADRTRSTSSSNGPSTAASRSRRASRPASMSWPRASTSPSV